MIVNILFPSHLDFSILVSFLVPQEFLYDPITKSYGDPSRRPEVRFGTVEYTATSDYMVGQWISSLWILFNHTL